MPEYKKQQLLQADSAAPTPSGGDFFPSILNPLPQAGTNIYSLPSLQFEHHHSRTHQQTTETSKEQPHTSRHRMHLAIRPAGKTMMAAVHARSASLPHEHSHPVLAYLDDSIRTLRSWSAGAAGQASGIALVDAVLAALDDLLALPQAVAALREATACDQILDRFLALADAYGTFQSALITLKQSVAELQVGTRRGDGVMVAASLRAHRRTEKELSRLVATMRHATRCTLARSRPEDTTGNEVIGIMAEVAAATAEASEAIFTECAAMPPELVPAIAQTSHRWLARLSIIRPSAKKAAPETALERLEKLEECIHGLETGTEKVFSRLLQSRVSLLNIHTPF